MSNYMTLLHKHKINGGFLAPDYIPFEERNKNEMLLELQNEIHTKDKEVERLNNITKRLEEDLREMYLTFGEFSEEYTENKIKELKGETHG